MMAAALFSLMTDPEIPGDACVLLPRREHTAGPVEQAEAAPHGRRGQAGLCAPSGAPQDRPPKTLSIMKHSPVTGRGKI